MEAGPAVERRVDVLGGLLACVCGRRLWNDGTFADGRHRKHHPNPCEVWGRKARLGDETWVSPVLSQVAGIALDQDTMESVVAALGSSRQPVAIDRPHSCARGSGDPGGHAGLGFRRLPHPPHTLEIDPDRMSIAVGLFERARRAAGVHLREAD